TNANGTYTIDLTSATTGVTKVSAHTTFSVGRRHTTSKSDSRSDVCASDLKTWVNAKIALSPDATNEVGQPHTFIVTLSKDPGTGAYVAAAGEHVSVTMPGVNLDAAASTCDDAGANTDAQGQCTIVFTSATA